MNIKMKQPDKLNLAEAHKLALKLGRAVPTEVLSSAMKLKQYVNSIKGQLIEKDGINGKAE
jgi:hypothetical protein